MEIYEQIIYHYTERELKEYLERHYFDAIGIGGCGGYYWYRKIKQIAEAVSNAKTEMFRREGIKPFFWMGGHLSSPDPEYFLRNFAVVDAVVIGDGKKPVRKCWKSYNGAEISGM